MESSSISKQQQTLASILQLSVFSKLFIPFGNFIFPAFIWLISKEKKFVDHHGRNAVNFQLSLLLYYLIIGLLLIITLLLAGTSIPLEILHFNSNSFFINGNHFNQYLPFLVILFSGGIILFGLIVFELYAVISAAKNASEGQEYKFPLCINFIKKHQLLKAESSKEI